MDNWYNYSNKIVKQSIRERKKLSLVMLLTPMKHISLNRCYFRCFSRRSLSERTANYGSLLHWTCDKAGSSVTIPLQIASTFTLLHICQGCFCSARMSFMLAIYGRASHLTFLLSRGILLLLPPPPRPVPNNTN